jgi:hypothetical protein
VAAQRRPDPVDLLDVESCDERRHRIGVDVIGVVGWRGEPFAAPSAWQVGYYNAGTLFSQRFRQDIKITPIARQAVQADHRSSRSRGTPQAVCHSMEAAASEYAQLLQERFH